MPTCPYCAEEIAPDQETAEHVMPRAIGGALTPDNPLKIPACRRCNSTCGRWVDGPFIRNWFVQNLRAEVDGMRFDPAQPMPLPLIFLGRDTTWTGPGDCDIWLGPSGDTIFHFHVQYPAAPTLVGRPPPQAGAAIDPGAVFIGVRARNPQWHPVLQLSVRDNFEGSPVHWLNAGDPVNLPFPPPAAEWAQAGTWALREFRAGTERQIQFAFDIMWGAIHSEARPRPADCRFWHGLSHQSVS